MVGTRVATTDLTARLQAAFPAGRAAEAARVAAILGACRHQPSADALGPVAVEGEALSIPMRVYHDPPAGTWVGVERGVLAAVLTRHADGFVRQRALATLVDVDEPWAVPFVLALVGEYVLPIILDVAAAADRLPARPATARFVADNPRFLALVHARAVSYWDAYRRDAYRSHRDDPAVTLVTELRRLVELTAA